MIPRVSFTIAVTLFVGSTVFAQEHPNSGGQSFQPPPQRSAPESGSSQEQRRDRIGKVATSDISAGIKNYIDGQAASSNDKKLLVTYGGKNLGLSLTKIHEDRLSNLGGGKYFACVDMKGTDGNTYDIDFFLSGGAGSMRVINASVHKVNGKPLYNWKQENGVWKKVSA